MLQVRKSFSAPVANALCTCLQQYWADKTQPYDFVPVQAFAHAFEASPTGQRNAAAMAEPFQRGSKGSLDALVRTRYASMLCWVKHKG